MVSSSPWTSSHPNASNHELVLIPFPLLEILASHATPEIPVQTDLLSYDMTLYVNARQPLWKRRVAQLQTTPSDTCWVTRLVLYTPPSGPPVIVGASSFHAGPDERGMVEVGYGMDPEHRRKGHARAALQILLDVARAQDEVKVVRATIGPWNEPSRRLVGEFGFQQVGTQWDEEDGEELIYEIAVE